MRFSEDRPAGVVLWGALVCALSVMAACSDGRFVIDHGEGAGAYPLRVVSAVRLKMPQRDYLAVTFESGPRQWYGGLGKSGADLARFRLLLRIGAEGGERNCSPGGECEALLCELILADKCGLMPLRGTASYSSGEGTLSVKAAVDPQDIAGGAAAVPAVSEPRIRVEVSVDRIADDPSSVATILRSVLDWGGRVSAWQQEIAGVSPAP